MRRHGVDDAGADPTLFRQAELGGGLRIQQADIGADRARRLRQIAVQIARLRFQKSPPPAGLLMRQTGPFGGQRALRSAGEPRAFSQEVGEVNK